MLLADCATRRKPSRPYSYVTLLASPDGSLCQVVGQGTRGEQLVELEHFDVRLDGSAAQAPVNDDRFQRDFAEAIAALPELPQTFALYFESGSTQPVPASQTVLPEILRSAAKRASADMPSVGNTDSIDSDELNEGLSLRRAQAAADWLRGQGLKVGTLAIEAQGKR